jgi:tetratricopeptide (TPR) repeat protein
MREPERAIESLNVALELSPRFALAHSHLGRAYLQLGRNAEAIAAFQQAVETGGTRASAQLAYAYATIGRREDASEIVNRLLANEGTHVLSPYDMGMALTGLHDPANACTWLERGVGELDPWITAINIDPAFDTIRKEPRFRAIVRRLGLDG